MPILQKYTPTLIGACKKAIELSETMVSSWLETNMFSLDPNPKDKAGAVVSRPGISRENLEPWEAHLNRSSSSLGTQD